MDIEKLKEKALSLPLVPGVYLMRDKNDKVIYVGKAKKLKNRVAQYFQDTASHSPKTRLMVSHVDHFEVIVAASEFEALVLECSLIKRHMPKYNILLKDDKGYPYIRIDRKAAYPRITLSNRIENDGASYYGPFGSRGITNGIIDTVNSLLKLPSCSKKFPRDIGKDRPCLQFHMGQCEGWCQKGREREAYLLCIAQAHDILSGNYKDMLILFNDSLSCRDDDLSILPYSRDYELAISIAAYFLNAFFEDFRVADYVFCDKCVVRVIIWLSSTSFTCSQSLDDCHAYHHAYQAERIADGTSHSHVVCLGCVIGIYLKQCLLCRSEHRCVGDCSGKKSHQVW